MSEELASEVKPVGNSVATSPTAPNLGQAEQPKLLKLISVSFKEAALDSPTFRAGVNHSNHLIEQAEQWIDGLLKFIKKFPQYYNEFKDFVDISMEQLNPTFLSDGIIDQDYTLSALTFSRSGLNILWVNSLKSFKLDDSELMNILNNVKSDIKSYKEYRKAFELAQSKYDLYLSRYSAQSKTKEPSALREDAFQLSEVRKSYIHISLEVCIALSNIQRSLDSSLVALSSTFWKDIDPALASVNPQIKYLYNQLEKIKSWAKACDFSLKILSKDMSTARRQIEESAIQQFTPSRDLNDHNPALINAGNLLDIKEPVYEKHGWLFMKTSVGKPARQIWVRRWAFVKNGMFGLLNLAPSKTFVQETDKIGVLLCNVRYAPHEDRRFCFEIKTIDTTIILQAETLNELKYWLTVFATEKKRSLEQIDKKKMTSSAFGRYPPLLSEFASTATTSCDFELTSGKIEINNNNGAPNNVIMSNNLSRLMNAFNKSANPDFSDYVPENINDVQFSKDGIFQEPILNTPIATRLTKAAIIANAFISPTVVPTAINANIWGTVNWGMYYLISPEARNKVSDESVNQKLLVSQSELENVERFASAIYPPYYPRELINHDIQMRALFESALQKDERCLLSFRCIWSPNLKQELSGRSFVTMDNIYFYMNSMGFVSLLMKNLNDLVSVESHYKKNWEILKVYAVDGLNMRAKIFLDDAKLIASKLEVLINNKTAVKPLSFKELIQRLENIDKHHEDIANTQEAYKTNAANGVPASKSQHVRAVPATKNPKTAVAISNATDAAIATGDEVPSLYGLPKTANGENFKADFLAEYDRLVNDSEVNLPAKALFHVLFGDDSIIFRKMFTMIVDGQSDGYVHLPWKITKGQNKLQRKIVFKLSTNSKNSLLIDSNKRLLDTSYNGIVLGKMSEVHTINDLVDNQYYNVSTERSSLELPLGAPFKIEARIIIKAVDSESCRLIIYSRLSFSKGSPANFLVANVYRSLFKDEARRMHEQIKECVSQIGRYGKINKAIKLYGQLGTKLDPKAQEESEKQQTSPTEANQYLTDDEDNVKFGFILLMKIWLKINAIRFIKLVFSILKITSKGIKTFFVSLSMNKFLILLLILSSFYNLWLTGKTSKSFWVAKRTERMIKEYTRLASNNINSNARNRATLSNHNGELMQRAIYSKDIEDLVASGHSLSIDTGSSKCFDQFKNNSFVLNYEKSSLDKLFLQKQYGDVASLQVAQKLQNTLQEIGVRRNELLIDLKILEKVEREIAIGEWKNWLLNENNRCNFVKEEIIAKVLKQGQKESTDSNNDHVLNNYSADLDAILPGAKELLSYCESCKVGLDNSYLL